MLFSIVIPVAKVNEYVHQNIIFIQKLREKNWELIVVTNDEETNHWLDDKRIKLIPSGRVSPAIKRDLAATIAAGEIIVFLDDDSYPEENLLNIAIDFFGKNPEICAIGGPAMTPNDNSILQKASGAVFLSKFSGGNPERYLPYGSIREIDDWPSVNFMIRKKDYLEVGGFDTAYWPGEDTFLCNKVIKASKKIVYVPSLKVWHHRRPSFFQHINQVYGYGLHRGFFFKKYPENSRKIKYLIPSIFFLYIIFGFIFIKLNMIDIKYYFIPLIIYFFALLVSFIQISKYENLIVGLISIPYILATHITYGFSFLKGFFKLELKSNLR